MGGVGRAEQAGKAGGKQSGWAPPRSRKMHFDGVRGASEAVFACRAGSAEYRFPARQEAVSSPPARPPLAPAHLHPETEAEREVKKSLRITVNFGVGRSWSSSSILPGVEKKMPPVCLSACLPVCPPPLSFQQIIAHSLLTRSLPRSLPRSLTSCASRTSRGCAPRPPSGRRRCGARSGACRRRASP